MIADEPDQPGADSAADDVTEEDLLVVLRLSNRQMGTAAERDAIEALAEQLEQAVLDAGVGEYDGDELGGGECLLFFAGPSADRLFAVLQPVLHKSRYGRGAIVRLQHGDETIEKRI